MDAKEGLREREESVDGKGGWSRTGGGMSGRRARANGMIKSAAASGRAKPLTCDRRLVCLWALTC